MINFLYLPKNSIYIQYLIYVLMIAVQLMEVKLLIY